MIWLPRRKIITPARRQGGFLLSPYRFGGGGGGGGDPEWASVASMLPMTGTNGSTSFPDATGDFSWVANGNAQVSTAQSRFGGGSALFDGSSDWLTAGAGSNFLVAVEQDFTCEYFVRPTGTFTRNYFHIDNRPLDSNGDYITIQHGSSGQIRFFYNGAYRIDSAGGVIVADTWAHIALVRASGVYTLYANGISRGTYSNDAAIGSGMVIGAGNQSTRNSLSGYMSYFRFTVGVARYTADFTPPDEAFPSS